MTTNKQQTYYWAIMHIPSGTLLPLLATKNDRNFQTRGFTHVEPMDPGPPRLFLTYDSAVRSLAAYLKGRHVGYNVESTDIFGRRDIDHTEVVVHPTTARNAKDFVIVQTTLDVIPLY